MPAPCRYSASSLQSIDRSFSHFTPTRAVVLLAIGLLSHTLWPDDADSTGRISWLAPRTTPARGSAGGWDPGGAWACARQFVSRARTSRLTPTARRPDLLRAGTTCEEGWELTTPVLTPMTLRWVTVMASKLQAEADRAVLSLSYDFVQVRKRRKKEKRKAQQRAQKAAERERRRLEKQRSISVARPGEEVPLTLPAVLSDSDDSGEGDRPPPPPPPLSHAVRAVGKRGSHTSPQRTCMRRSLGPSYACRELVLGWIALAGDLTHMIVHSVLAGTAFSTCGNEMERHIYDNRAAPSATVAPAASSLGPVPAAFSSSSVAVSLDQLLLLPQVPVGNWPLSVGPLHCKHMHANISTSRRNSNRVCVALLFLWSRTNSRDSHKDAESWQ